MNTEAILGLIGVLIGIMTIAVAIVQPWRQRRQDRPLSDQPATTVVAQLRAFAAERGTSLTIDDEELLREFIRQRAGIAAADVAGMNGRTGRPEGPVTVEVEREDGSTASLGLDPDDAASVRAFLRDARQSGANRVLAVR